MLKRLSRWMRQRRQSAKTTPTAIAPPPPSVNVEPAVPAQAPLTAMQLALDLLGPAAMTAVDVGARWGAASAWFRLKPLARLIGFEPDPVECQRLNLQAEPGQERFFPVALGGHDGEATLYVTREPACSSLYPPASFILERFPSLRRLMALDRTARVPLTTLATWSTASQVARVDFVKLDTQGAELEILRGAGRLLDDCLGVEAEVMFTPLYEGQPLFADVDRYLRGRGFTLWRLDSMAHYTDRPSERVGPAATAYFEHVGVRHATGDGRLIWANAIYFRDRAQVRGSARELLILAALLEAAGDIDGSHCCLEEAAVASGLPDAARERLRQLLPASGPLTVPTAPEPGEPCLADPEAYLRGLPFDAAVKRRIAMTAGCEDCHGLPKVPGAGGVYEEGTTRYQRMHNGIKVLEDGYCGRWMTELIRLLRGHHEPQEERAFHEILRHLAPGSTMVELGSYWAYYALWFSRDVAGGRAVLLEPDPGHLEVGRRNFALNGAVGEFHQYSIGRSSTPPKPFACESDLLQRPVPEISVDDLVEQLNLPRVDLLLADIQGAELAMLEGAVRALNRGGLRFVFVSTHHHQISGDPLTHQKCLRFIREHGGHVMAEHDITESYSGDGLIVASFDPADRSLLPIPLSRNHPTNSLFPELEYDLDEAWQTLAEVGRAFEADPRLAETRDALRQRRGLLNRVWPASSRHTAA